MDFYHTLSDRDVKHLVSLPDSIYSHLIPLTLLHSVAKTYFIKSIMSNFKNYTLFILFQSNTLKLLYYGMKLSKRIQSI